MTALLRAEAFIVHLKRAELRRPQVERLSAMLPLPVNVLDAVDGLALSQAKADAVYHHQLYRPRYPFELRRTEIACFLSHRSAWQAIVDGGLDAGLIVEDDVELDETLFGPALAMAMAEIRPGDYIRFPHRPHSDKGEVVAEADRVRLVRPDLIGTGMLMQLVSREAAEELLKATEIFDRPVDTTIQLRRLPGIQVLAMHPPAVREIGNLLGGSVVQSRTPKPLGEVVSREIRRARYRLALRLYRAWN